MPVRPRKAGRSYVRNRGAPSALRLICPPVASRGDKRKWSGWSAAGPGAPQALGRRRPWDAAGPGAPQALGRRGILGQRREKSFAPRREAAIPRATCKIPCRRIRKQKIDPQGLKPSIIPGDLRHDSSRALSIPAHVYRILQVAPSMRTIFSCEGPAQRALVQTARPSAHEAPRLSLAGDRGACRPMRAGRLSAAV